MFVKWFSGRGTEKGLFSSDFFSSLLKYGFYGVILSSSFFLASRNAQRPIFIFIFLFFKIKFSPSENTVISFRSRKAWVFFFDVLDSPEADL